MGEEPKKVEASAPLENQPVQEEKKAAQNAADQEKSVIPVPDKVAEASPNRDLGGSTDRDSVLAQVATEKRFALVKAWEENEKAKAQNKAHKKVSAVGSWENGRKASVEAKLKKFEEKMEKKKAEYTEKMKNKMAEIHRTAEEKKADIEAKRGESSHKIEETAAKFRATGYTPKTKLLGCFSS